MVLTCGCGGVTETAEHRRGRSGAALTGIPCEAHKLASLSRLQQARGASVRTISSQSRLDMVRVKSLQCQEVEVRHYQYRLVPMTGADNQSFGGLEDRSRRCIQ